MAEPSIWARFRAMQTGGMYLHGNASDPTLYGAANAAISATYGKARPSIVEISFGGGFYPGYFSTEYSATILSNYTPTVAVVSIDNVGFSGQLVNPAYSTAYPTQSYNPTQAQINAGAAGNANPADWPVYVAAGLAVGLKVMVIFPL